MRIYTGRSHLLEAALLKILRPGLAAGENDHLVVVPKQLTLQTERTLLDALGLTGSFRLQVLSPERLCGRIFDAAGQPSGVRVDERGRVLLVARAVRSVAERLKLYRGQADRPGFYRRCARQLELFRQAGKGAEQLFEAARQTEGILSMKLDDMGVILEAYEGLLAGRYQDGESEFAEAARRAREVRSLKDAAVYFFGFDLTPPSLHRLMAAVAAVCGETHVFLPLAGEAEGRDLDAYLPMRDCLDRLVAAARREDVWPRVIPVSDEGPAREDRLVVTPPAQAPELRRLARELFAYPPSASEAPRPPRHLQAATLQNPLEECRFAAALCRQFAMTRGWRWGEMLILCRDIDRYRQVLKTAFRDYDVPLFLSASRAASRHPLAECLMDALRMIEGSPRMEDAEALLGTGYMPLSPDEAHRLVNFATKTGLKPWGLLRPLRRGTEAEQQELEPLRLRFAEPLLALKERLKAAGTLQEQLAALFGFLTDIDAQGKLQAQLDRLAEEGLREQAGESAQVWNRIIGALDEMAELMGEAKRSPEELRKLLTESLDAAIIKPLPQSADAVYAQTTDRITAQQARVLIILGETDRAAGDVEGLLSSQQLSVCARLLGAWLGSDGMEMSRMRRFYLKSALGMVSDYVCLTCPLCGPDGSAQRPGILLNLVRGIFPALPVRGGVAGDEGIQRMLRNAPLAASAYAASALSRAAGGEPMAAWDADALAGLAKLACSPQAPLPHRERLVRELDRMDLALRRNESAEALSPAVAARLYGDLRTQSISRLETFAWCPFAYFARYGLRPERIDPWALTPRDEGSFLHEAVRAFLSQSASDLNDLAEAAARDRMDAIAERLLDAMAESGPLGDSALAQAERRRLKATAGACAAVLAEHMRGSRFSPAALESDFGPEDGARRIALSGPEGGCTLEGRIDRVDAWEEGGYLRVIDYKRGGRPLALDEVYHGLSLQLPVYLAASVKRHGAGSAGVYYFPLEEGILSTQSTDPAEVARQRQDRFRLTGLSLDSMETLQAQSPNFQDVLNVKVKADGALSKTSLVTDDRGFEALMDHALKKAAEQLAGVRAGRVSPAPVEYRQRSACQYCDWKGLCGFERQLDQRSVRTFPPLKPDEALKRLKLEEQGDGENSAENQDLR
ncbi:MAG: PD-(D/E)XK nuclease family protein [Clostridia bacterium]|nr:PD-(D/E)XK nuclease family protein [Clostridia bacterium]